MHFKDDATENNFIYCALWSRGALITKYLPSASRRVQRILLQEKVR